MKTKIFKGLLSFLFLCCFLHPLFAATSAQGTMCLDTPLENATILRPDVTELEIARMGSFQ